MKNYIIKMINYLETKKESNPKTFKILYIALFCIAPIEMISIKLGIFGYKKLKSYNDKVIREMK